MSDKQLSKSPDDSAAIEVDVQYLVRKFPPPWSFDLSPHPTPKYCRIYAADSTRISSTYGEDAERLARLIVDAVNQFLPNGKEIRSE